MSAWEQNRVGRAEKLKDCKKNYIKTASYFEFIPINELHQEGLDSLDIQHEWKKWELHTKCVLETPEGMRQLRRSMLKWKHNIKMECSCHTNLPDIMQPTVPSFLKDIRVNFQLSFLYGSHSSLCHCLTLNKPEQWYENDQLLLIKRSITA
jgi:hypothetical protein